MKRTILCVLLASMLGFGLAGPARPAAQAQDNCDQLVPSRLQTGATTRVLYDGDGLGVVLRDNPGKEQSGSQIIRALPEGTVLTVLNGPICVDAAIWWNVELPTGDDGWVAEGDVAVYFLEPFTISAYIVQPDAANPRQLNRWRIDADGSILTRDSFTVPGNDPAPASQLWQQPDLDAANAVLAERRAECPQALNGTPWQNVTEAGEVIVPEGPFDFYPSPDGGKVFLVRHRVVLMPACNEATGKYYGASTVHLLSNQGVSDLFPYGQNSGARSKDSCLAPDVSNPAWNTHLSQVVWSPDSDTVAFTARYLDRGSGDRPCAFYYTFMVDAFSGNVAPIAEGRRVGWGEGGTRLYYFTQEVDTGYNILGTRMWQLSNGETTQIGLPAGAQPLPPVFDSTEVVLPWSSDGRQVLLCAGETGCPNTISFEILDRQPTPPNPVPDELQPFTIETVTYVAGDTRLLWLATDGHVYLQAIRGIDAGNWEEVTAGTLDNTAVEAVSVMPTGVFVVLHLDNGEYALLNTISREVVMLGQLAERDALDPEDVPDDGLPDADAATPTLTPTPSPPPPPTSGGAQATEEPAG